MTVDREHEPAVARQTAVGEIVEAAGKPAADLILGRIGVEGAGCGLQPDPFPGDEIDRQQTERRADHDRPIDRERGCGGEQRHVLVGERLTAGLHQPALTGMAGDGHAVSCRQQRPRGGGEAVDLETGRAAWTCGFNADGAAPSGRGVLTADRLFLPLDVPEVIEIDLVAGTIAGRAPARGGAVPGNLVAYRGEMISVGCDCLDVFHQVEALEPRIETALRGRSDAGWAAHWGGQLDIDRGRIAAGMSRLLEACRTVPGGLPPDEVAAALETASDRDFPAAPGTIGATSGRSTATGSPSGRPKPSRKVSLDACWS